MRCQRFTTWLASLCALVVTTTSVLSAQVPSPALLIVSRTEKPEGSLGIVDPVAGKVVSRISTGIDPHGVTVSSDGKLAFVANTNSHNKTVPEGDSISVIDLAAGKEIRRVEAGNGTRPHDIHFAAGRVFFTATGFRAVGSYDLKRNKVDYFGLGQEGPHILAFSRDLNTIYASNPGSNNVAVIESVLAGPVISFPPKPTDWKISLIAVGKAPEGIDISPDGKEVWTANEEGGGVSIIDVARKIAKSIDLQTKHANRLKFTPDGKRVLLLDREIAELVVVDAASHAVIKRLRFPGDRAGDAMEVGDVAIVPDGSRAYINVTGRPGARHYIAAVDLKTLEMTGRIDTGDRSDYIVWVPAH